MFSLLYVVVHVTLDSRRTSGIAARVLVMASEQKLTLELVDTQAGADALGRRKSKVCIKSWAKIGLEQWTC